MNAADTFGATSESRPAFAKEVRRLATLGFCLFPCRPRDKKPAIAQWPDRATCAADQIEAWAREFPNCNWGIAAWKSGFFAVDVDRKPARPDAAGQDGFQALANWSAEHPETKEWLRTSSIHTARGTHYLFSYPRDHEIPNSTGLLAAAIDIRGWHGYVMAPGSIHPDGTVYEWANEEPITPAPRWLLEKIRLAHSRSAASNNAPRNTNGNNDATISCGYRNSMLTSIAGAMRRRGVGRAAIEAALNEINRTQCEIPLPEDEVATIAASIARYEPDQPKLKLGSAKAAATAPARHISRPDQIPDPRSLARDRVKFLVEGFIPMGSVAVVAAEYAVGKTWIGLILASALKRGGTFIGRDVTRCEQVLYFDRENPLAVVQERMDAIYTDEEEAHRHWGLWCAVEPPLLDHSLLLEFARPGTVMIFDALIRFHRADENRPSEMALVMGHLRHLQSKGATVIVFHHRDKKLEAAYRGSTEIAAGADVLYSLAREEGNLVLRAVKARVQVDQVITFRADWDEARLVPTELNSVLEKRALVDEIRDYIRRSPGISQSGIAKSINATLVKPVSRWRIQRVLDQHEGSLWRADRGPSGTKTGYFDLFSTSQKELLIDDRSNARAQQVVSARSAGPAAGAAAGLVAMESSSSTQPAGAAEAGQQLLPTQPAELPPTYIGGRTAGGVDVLDATSGRRSDDHDAEGAQP